MKLVIISDTHLRHSILEIPQGDVLVHCGDMLNFGKPKELIAVNEWFKSLSFPKERIVCISGNHDFIFQRDAGLAKILMPDATYLQDSGHEIDGIKFWGSPWTSLYGNWAFEACDENRQRRWSMIPDDTDVLITHAPPYGIGDEVWGDGHIGDKLLRTRIEQINPLLCCYGHIHEGWGKVVLNGTTFVNASIMNENYRPRNKPMVIEI